MKKQLMWVWCGAMMFVACTKEELVEQKTIADKVTIVTKLNGAEIEPGDTLVINEKQDPTGTASVWCQIQGLEDGEFVEVYTKNNTLPDQSLSSEDGVYGTFDELKNNFTYTIAATDFIDIYAKDLTTTLKFRCSDGSEKWIKYAVDLVVDSSLYKPKLSISSPSGINFAKTIELQKGQGFFFYATIEAKSLKQMTLNLRSANYFNDIYLNTSILPGNDETVSSAKKEIYVAYEPNLTARVITIQADGRYGLSNLITFLVTWSD